MADRQARELAEILQRAQSLAQRLGSAGTSNVAITRASTASAATITTSLRPSSTWVPHNNNASSNASNPINSHASGATEQSSVLGNYRRLFAPYQRTNQRTNQRTARNTHGRSNQKRKNESWTHEFFCLSSVEHTFAPNQRQKLELHEAGLGRKKIVFDNNGDANHIKNRLEDFFPKLKESGGFEILRSQGRIDPLKTIVPPRSGYSVPFLRDQSSLGTAVAYIRPIQKDLDLSQVTPVDPQAVELSGTDVTAPYTVQCFLCSKAYALDEIRAHREVCCKAEEISDPVTIPDSDEEDPPITCENCSAQVQFSKYNEHVEQCTEAEDGIMSLSTVVNTSGSETDGVGVRRTSTPSATSTSASRDAEVATDLEQLVRLTNISEEYCGKFLNTIHEGDLASATDDFLDRGSLGILLSALSTKLAGPNRCLKISSSEDAFPVAFTYFKGPEYKEISAISVQSGIAIDVGGPMRQFFEDVFKVIVAGKCLKLFEGSEGRMAPVNSSSTVMSGVLETVGRICAHSMVQGGPTFAHLSPAVYWYIATGSTDLAMQHRSYLDVVSPGVKFVIDKVLAANSNDELVGIMKDTDVQIVLEESNWDKQEKVEVQSKQILIQWLMQNDILFKRMLAIEKFSKGLEALGLLQCVKRYPKVFESCFIWNEEAVTSRAVLEMLEVAEDLDETCSQIYEWFQEFIFDLSIDELRTLLQFMTGCSVVPHSGQRQRSIHVEFCEGEAIYVSTCILQITLPKGISSKEELIMSIRATMTSNGSDYNTW